jgi:hypothetical protein
MAVLARRALDDIQHLDGLRKHQHAVAAVREARQQRA